MIHRHCLNIIVIKWIEHLSIHIEWQLTALTSMIRATRREVAVLLVSFLCIFIGCSSDPAITEKIGTLDWKNYGPVGGQISHIAIDQANENILYACWGYQGCSSTKGQLWKSTDGGDSWNSLDFLNEQPMSVAIDPGSSQIVYVATKSQGVYKSINSGNTWSPINNNLSTLNTSLIVVDWFEPNTIYCGTPNHGMFKSTNGGADWIEVNTGLTSHEILCCVIDPGEHQTLYIGTLSGGVFKSVDGGLSWNSSNTGLTPFRINALVINPEDSSVLGAATTLGFYRSEDGGAYWTAHNSGLGNGPLYSLAIAYDTPNLLYAGKDHLYKSSDGGLSWEVSEFGLETARVTAITISPQNSQLIFCGNTETGIFRSEDAGSSWTVCNSGLSLNPIYDLSIDTKDQSVIYAASLCCDVFKSTDSGYSWYEKDYGFDIGPTYSISIDPLDSKHLYAGTAMYQTDGGVYQTINGGDNWVATNNDQLGYRHIYKVAQHPRRPNVVYAASDVGGFITTDNGKTWSFLGPSKSLLTVAVDPLDPSTLYWGGQGLYKSTDGGQTWVPANSGIGSIVTSILIDPNNTDRLFASTRGGIFLSPDGAASWTAVNDGLENLDVNCLAFEPGDSDIVYAGIKPESGQGGGVWKRTDEQLWLSLGLSDCNVTSLALTNQCIYAGTEHGVFKKDGCYRTHPG